MASREVTFAMVDKLIAPLGGSRFAAESMLGWIRRGRERSARRSPPPWERYLALKTTVEALHATNYTQDARLMRALQLAGVSPSSVPGRMFDRFVNHPTARKRLAVANLDEPGGATLHVAGATFNHTREDSPRTPCEACAP